MSKLLVETVDRSILEVLNEQHKTGRKLYIEGPFIMTEKDNRNGRWYPRAMMEPVVDTYINDYVNDRRAIGELNHPEYPFPNIRNSAILTQKLDWKGDDVMGKALVLEDMPDGKAIKCLLDAGYRLGVSTRGLGETVRGHDGRERVTDYSLYAIDAVDRPSGQSCYVNSLNESVWAESNGVWAKIDMREATGGAAAVPAGAAINEAVLLNNLDKYIEKMKGAGKTTVSTLFV